MKKIFKKNQVIITALALMLCAAGYLQFSDAKDTVDTAGKGSGYEQEVSDNNLTEAKEQKKDSVTINVEAQEEHQIGEAVLVSTTIQSNFTTNARLVREQRRAKSKESLMAVINNTSLSEDQKQSAVETLVNLTTIAEKENAAELLLEAKGFADPIVNISEGEVDVVINATSVTDRQIAQIEDIVTRKTGYEVEDITITAAIQED